MRIAFFFSLLCHLFIVSSHDIIKDVVDGAPKVVKEQASKEEAEDIKTKLEAEGAKVTLK